MWASVRSIVASAIVVVAFLNLWQVNKSLRWVRPREADDVVILEDRLRYVRNALMKDGYWRGDVGYVPAGVLRGASATSRDDQQWVLVRYVMIPWNVLQNVSAVPYVLVDGTRTGKPIQPPEGFSTVYDSTDGFVLLKRVPRQ